ncbi:MAG: FCD domain-containing protein, partial [Synergistaceae bacterium]|nr:FCD domain-containing protein [Synergistaceae bacterium]
MLHKTLFKSIYRPPVSLCDPIIEAILALIRNGDLKQGDKLPPQDIMASQLSVSRTSLREALKELSYRGIVNCVHGRGTFVSDRFATTAEIIEARRIIEPGAAALAATRMTKSDWAKLAALVDEMEGRVESNDFQGFSMLDLEFHMKINEFAGNPALISMMQTLRDVMLVQQLYVQKLPGAIRRAYDFHKKILLHLEEQDPDAAAT